MIGLAYVLSGSRSAAEDLAQEGFLAAHNAWDRVSLYEKPEAALTDARLVLGAVLGEFSQERQRSL